MKKRILIAFLVGFFAITGIAKAGNSAELSVTSNGKEDPGGKSTKTQEKYTFTLFSFFITDNQRSKSDSSKALLKTPIRKEEKIN